MARRQLLLECPMYYSYSQFMLYDSLEQEPWNDWSEAHSAQGFARRPSSVAFVTLDEFGTAQLRVFASALEGLDTYARAISVCIVCVSGRLVIAGPEEWSCNRQVEVGCGIHQLICAQVGAADELQIDLFVRKVPSMMPSSILKADPLLHPPVNLLEQTAKL